MYRLSSRILLKALPQCKETDCGLPLPMSLHDVSSSMWQIGERNAYISVELGLVGYGVTIRSNDDSVKSRSCSPRQADSLVVQ